MRLWGQDGALLESVGLDVDALAGLEHREGAGLPHVPRFDAHAHLGTDADGHHMAAADLVADMDAWEVGWAVVFPANEPGPDGDFMAANRAVRSAAAAHPGRLVPFCRVDPAGTWEPVMDDAARGGAVGLKLHPVAQHFAVDDPRVVACVASATALGWPVLLHAGFGARSLAAALVNLLDRVPGARLILAHGARGDARAVAAALGDHPGVWFDTSLAALPDLVDLPPERLLFGADRPYGEYATALALVALAADAAGWTRAQRAGVLGGTLAALLGRA